MRARSRFERRVVGTGCWAAQKQLHGIPHDAGANNIAQLVLGMTPASCARHDVDFVTVTSPSGETTFTYTISDSVLERLSGAQHTGQVSFELTAATGGAKLTNYIDQELRALALCPEHWRFTRAWHVPDPGMWIFEGRCVPNAIKG